MIGYSQHSSHYKVAVQRPDKSVWVTNTENKIVAGDTLALSATNNPYSYMYISISPNDTAWIRSADNRQIVFTGGMKIENSNFITIDGTGTDSTYGFSITGGGTNFTITGKSNYIDVGYVQMANGVVGGIFDKTEVSEVQSNYNCDKSYLYPTRAMYHHLHHLKLSTIHGDGIYEGSTGSTGGRDMTCNGVTTQPKPMGVGFIEIDHIILNGINRQGIQISGADTGYVLLHDNTVTSTGRELVSDQGAGMAFGSGTKNGKFYNNTIKYSYLNNFYSFGSGDEEVHDNVMDSSGYVILANGTLKKNIQQNAALWIKPTYTSPSSVKLIDNTVGYNTSNVNVLIDAGNHSLTRIDTCNTGSIITNNSGVAMSNGCTAVTTYTVTATAGANTSIIPSGTSTLNAGSDISYVITVSTGYHLTGVIVDGSNIGTPSTYTFSSIAANHTIATTAAINTYTITSSAGANGSISPNGATVKDYNTSQAYTITPSAMYHIVDVSVDGISQGVISTYTFSNIVADHTISATFGINTFSITSAATIGGSINPSGTAIVNSGTNKTYSIFASANYALSSLLVDGVSVTPVTSYTFSSIAANHTIAASFTPTTNIPPVAVTSALVTLSSNATYTSLDGTQSYDVDGHIVSYLWEQLSGVVSVITNPNDAFTNITGLSSGTYSYRLTVTDDKGDIGRAMATVTVSPVRKNGTRSVGIRIQNL